MHESLNNATTMVTVVPRDSFCMILITRTDLITRAQTKSRVRVIIKIKSRMRDLRKNNAVRPSLRLVKYNYIDASPIKVYQCVILHTQNDRLS